MNDINQLKEKLDSILDKQQCLSAEIQQLRNELQKLEYSHKEKSVEQAFPNPETHKTIVLEAIPSVASSDFVTPERKVNDNPAKELRTKPAKEKSNLEKFIGENLISAIGIGITIIGAAIGVKYSIDNQLISPLVRIILGYLLGLGLLGTGIRLKNKYRSYSAVLVSGSMAIMYFLTYAGYEFYNLIHQVLAFSLMLIFTVFTVTAAIKYNRQIIAHIGLVGAYAVPFLLSSGSGQMAVLFTYMSIINMGILFVAYKKYWKPLYYSSFGLTWFIYLIWYIFKYNTHQYFGLAIIFLCIFFVIFYAIFLVYKIAKKEKYSHLDIVPLLINSFLFYGIGYSILKSNGITNNFLGLFTFGNAVIHFVVSMIVYRHKLTDKNLHYFILALFFTFLTIAIPIQLGGNWVTLLWTAEACILFIVGVSKNISILRNISYPLMLLAFGSLIDDWVGAYLFKHTVTPLTNIHFLTSMIFVVAFGFINYWNNRFEHFTDNIKYKNFIYVVNFCIPAILLLVLYFSIWLEITNYYNILYSASSIEINTSGLPEVYFNEDLNKFKQIWIINYSLLFISAVGIVNLVRLKSKKLGISTLILSVIFIVVFLTSGLYNLSELRESYLHPSELFNTGATHIWLCYLSIFIVGIAVYILYRQVFAPFMQPAPVYRKICFDFVFYTSLLWIASSELIHWLDMAAIEQSYKFELSILWGIYALLLIGLGIWKKKKHLRIGGMVLLGITLIKLVFYDLYTLSTIKKTIVLIILGILMLIVSFLYHKYKHLIGNETDNQK